MSSLINFLSTAILKGFKSHNYTNFYEVSMSNFSRCSLHSPPTATQEPKQCLAVAFRLQFHLSICRWRSFKVKDSRLRFPLPGAWKLKDKYNLSVISYRAMFRFSSVASRMFRCDAISRGCQPPDDAAKRAFDFRICSVRRGSC